MSENVRSVFRLTEDQYKALEKQATAGFNVVPKTEIEAGMQIGINNVLSMVRKGFVIGP